MFNWVQFKYWIRFSDVLLFVLGRISSSSSYLQVQNLWFVYFFFAWFIYPGPLRGHIVVPKHCWSNLVWRQLVIKFTHILMRWTVGSVYLSGDVMERQVCLLKLILNILKHRVKQTWKDSVIWKKSIKYIVFDGWFISPIFFGSL